ncbi:MAG: hypothetical protein AB8B87_23670 [Granulosicoccus sp.]
MTDIFKNVDTRPDMQDRIFSRDEVLLAERSNLIGTRQRLGNNAMQKVYLYIDDAVK